jgi:hypothetical protein
MYSQGMLAQSEYTVDGDVQDAEIVIEKERKIELNKQYKLYEFIKWKPERILEAPPSREFAVYSYNLAYEETKFNPIKPKIQKKKDNFDQYLKVGFGNYISPLVDLSLTTSGNANQTAGVNVKHYSFGKGEVDGKNSGSGTTELNLFGVLVGEKTKIGGAINYKLDNNYYYGYPTGQIVNNDDIKHNSNFLSANINLKDNKEDAWDYELGLDYHGYSDNFDAKENTVLYDLTVGYSDKIFINTEGVFSKYQDIGRDKSRSYFRINPYYTLVMESLKVDVGMSVSLQSDSFQKISSNRFFPYINAKYELNSNYSLFALLDGGYSFNSLYEYALNMPVLNQSVELANSERLVDMQVGMMGNPMEQLGLKAMVRYQSIRNLQIFINDVTDQSRMNIAYATEPSNVFQIGGEAQYKINAAHHLKFGANYFSYTSDSYKQIYHKPSVELIIGGDHTFIEKLSMNWQFAYTGGLKAYEAIGDQSIALDGIPKFDLNFHYQLKERVGVFLLGKNLLNRNYSRYLNYPQRGIVIQGGITVRL